MLKTLLHGMGVANFGYALYFDLVFVHLPPHLAKSTSFSAMSAFPGKWKYLTVWDMVVQLVYHSIALINDFAGTHEVQKDRQSFIQRFRDGLFAAWAFPTGLFVSVVFWGVYSFDRELMFPAVLDSFYPTWLNHAVHTAPVIFGLLEHLFVPITYPRPLLGAGILVGGTAVYLSWITWINQLNGVWAYPILDVLNNVQRAAFMGGSGLAILGFYFLGETINSLRWGKVESKSSSGKSGKSSKGKRKTK